MISESAEGVSSAALRPWTARAAMSWLPLSANPLTSGGDGEQGQAGQEDAASREQVGDAAAEEQAAAGHHQVGRDQPLQLAAVEVQRAADGGQGGVDDGDVEHDQDLGGQGDGEQGPGLPGAASSSSCGRCGRAASGWAGGVGHRSSSGGWLVVGCAWTGRGGHCVARGEPVRTAETTSVMARTDSAAGVRVLDAARRGWTSTSRWTWSVESAASWSWAAAQPGVVEALGGGEHGERAAVRAW